MTTSSTRYGFTDAAQIEKAASLAGLILPSVRQTEAEIHVLLRTKAAVFCWEVSPSGLFSCDRVADHDGRHSWEWMHEDNERCQVPLNPSTQPFNVEAQLKELLEETKVLGAKAGVDPIDRARLIRELIRDIAALHLGRLRSS